MIFARNAQSIAAIAKKLSVCLAADSVRIVRNLHVATALVNAKSAVSCFVNHVWKMMSVQIAEKKRRTKMNNRKQILKNLKIQANLKQKQQRSSWRVRTIDKERLALRFSPTAWAKLLYFRDQSDNEVGGFGITDPDDLIFVREFITVKQEVTPISVRFDDSAVADFFDTQVDLGRKPEQFARIWLHSHPGDSPEPSGIDEDTFERVFGNCEWAVLFVVARDNNTYAKLSFNVGPGGQVLIPTEIDYSRDFVSSDHDLWDTEYVANVKATEWLSGRPVKDNSATEHNLTDYALPYDFLEEFEKMEPEERQFILDELADRPELWDESEVMFL
jgi:proteasome lid subunit RPN8/RPN11